MSELPVEGRRDEIVAAVRNNQVVVIEAPTGTGKSTRVPMMLYEEGFASGGMIAVTEPKKLAAMKLAQFVAKSHDSTLGRIIGYQIGGDKKDFGSLAVKYMTNGLLLREMLDDPKLLKYKVIVIDEVHDRARDQDLILKLVRRLLTRRFDLRVVVMSATFDVARVSEYFGGAPIISVEARQYPVEIHYLDETPWRFSECIMKCAQKAIEYLTTMTKGDVLVFMPDEASIRQTIEEIENQEKDARQRWGVHALFGAQSREDSDEAFAETSKRRVIVATNIAETGITIGKTDCVIDSGYVKQSVFVSKHLSALKITETSRAQSMQRTGRTGRTGPGICYRMYSRESFEDRALYTEPDILRTTLDQVLLDLRVLGFSKDEIATSDYLDSPEAVRWEEAFESLKMLGCVDEDCNVTDAGHHIHRLGVAPMFGAMLVAAEKSGCVYEMAVIVSAFSLTKPLLVRPYDRAEEADERHKKFLDTTSDALTIINVWDAYVKINKEQKVHPRDWARENFVSSRGLEDIGRNIRIILDVFRKDGMEIVRSTDTRAIRKAVAAGLMMNLCSRTYCGYNYRWHDREDIQIFPGSGVFGANPHMMVAVQVRGSKTKRGDVTFALSCSEIDPAWLLELIPAGQLTTTCKIERHDSYEIVSWQGHEISRKILDHIHEAGHRHLASHLASLIIDENMYDPFHRDIGQCVDEWIEAKRFLREELGLDSYKVIPRELIEEAMKALSEHLLEQIKDTTTLEEFRACDIRFSGETVLPERYRDAFRVMNEERRREIEEEQEIQKRVREAMEAAQQVAREREEARRAKQEARAAGDIAITTTVWDNVLKAFPACPLCGSGWKQTGTPSKLQCVQIHGWGRFIPHTLIYGHSTNTLVEFYGGDGEVVATMKMWNQGVVFLEFTHQRNQPWSGKPFKSVTSKEFVVFLSEKLSVDRMTIIRDLEELREERKRLAALDTRMAEAERSVAKGKMKRLTFKTERGIAVAREGMTEYYAAMTEVYPNDGETWYCGIGKQLPVAGYVIEVHPKFQVVVTAEDLKEYAKVLAASYPGLQVEAFIQ